jgi:hypothetical protein
LEAGVTLLGSEQAGIGSIPTAAGPDSPGINPPDVIPTLAEVYAAGAGDVQADDVFAMPSGNLRFIGNEGPNGVPGVALYESATTSGDSRLASWYTRRYLHAGIGVGQTVGNALIGYDPTWDGTFGRLDGTKLTVARVGYTATDDQTSAGADLIIGDASFQSLSGFFDGPVCFPTPGLNAGSVETFVLDLWQHATTTTRGAFTFSGWGQTIQRPLPLSNGVTAAIDFRPDWSKIATAADDGIGIMWRRGDDDPPVAMVDAHMLTSNAAGDYGLAFWARNAGTLSKIATFDWTNGIQFLADVKTPQGGTATVYFTSALVDLTVVQSGIVIVPAVSGKAFHSTGLFLEITAVAGTYTSGASMQVFEGTGTPSPGLTNVPSSATFAMGAPSRNSLGANGSYLMVASTALTVNVTVAAAGTGGFVCQGRFIATGFFV